MKKIIALLVAFALLSAPLSNLSADYCESSCDYGCGYEDSCRSCCCSPQLIIGAVLLAGIIAAIVVNDHSSSHHHHAHN